MTILTEDEHPMGLRKTGAVLAFDILPYLVKIKRSAHSTLGRPTALNTLIASTVLSLILTGPLAAEKQVEDFHTWAGMEITGDLSSITPNLRNFRYKLFTQGRFGDYSSRFTQGLIRPGIGYALNEKTTVWLGYDWVPTSRPLALRHPFNDHRVWQQLSLKDQYSFGTVISRTRLEQRFFDIPGSTDVAHRYRQMFKLSAPMPSISPKISFVVWNEIFVDLNTTDVGIKSGLNQNWAFAGIGYHLNNKTTVEIGYLNQYLNRPRNPRPDQMHHVLSVNMLLNF
jgi:uncharacterized protein DUF2490